MRDSPTKGCKNHNIKRQKKHEKHSNITPLESLSNYNSSIIESKDTEVGTMSAKGFKRLLVKISGNLKRIQTSRCIGSLPREESKGHRGGKFNKMDEKQI